YQASRNTKTEITEKSCDYCLKKVPVANMERVATSAVNTSGVVPIPMPMPMPMPYADYPAGEFQQAQNNLGRF
ncbi:hypothetical protein BG011_007709, partial [Mortierella polycephala]